VEARTTDHDIGDAKGGIIQVEHPDGIVPQSAI